MNQDFNKFARSKGISTNSLNKYKTVRNRIAPKMMNPMIIEERQMNASVISVFDRLMMDRIIFLGEEIDDDVANVINAQLLYLDSEDNSDEPIWLYINSPGGDVYSGLAIYDTMQMIKSKVYTNILGIACSMAFVLSISGEKKHRYASKHSRLLMHQPLGGIPFSQATDIDIYNKEMQEVKSDLIEIMALHTKQTVDKIKIDCDRDFWFTAQRALEYGAIDKILTKI